MTRPGVSLKARTLVRVTPFTRTNRVIWASSHPAPRYHCWPTKSASLMASIWSLTPLTRGVASRSLTDPGKGVSHEDGVQEACASGAVAMRLAPVSSTAAAAARKDTS